MLSKGGANDLLRGGMASGRRQGGLVRDRRKKGP
jgi:hypothetical protein